MKVGDLVRCPETIKPSLGYVGVIIGVYGHKVEVLGGDVVSWDGIKGKRSWDKADLSLVKR